MSNEPPQYPGYPGPDEPQPGQQPPPPPGYGQAPPAHGQPAYGQAPPAYGQSAYGQPYGPPPGYGYPAPPKNNGKALAGMILGIVSIMFCYLGVLIGPAGIILSVMGRNDIKRSNGAETGGGMAIAGLVTGIVGTVVWLGIDVLLVLSVVYDW